MVSMNSRYPARLRSGAVLRPVLTVLLVLLLTAVAGWMIVALPRVAAADLALVIALNEALGPVSGAVAVGVDTAFGPVVALCLLLLAVVGAAALRRSLVEGARTGILLVMPWGAAEMLKFVVGRSRPDASLLAHHLAVPPGSFSFPSGHTAFAAALCCGILLLLSPGHGRRIGVLLAVVVIAITGWSRVALGMHHPSDVLASALLVPFLACSLSALLGVLLPLRDERVEDAIQRAHREPRIP